MTTSTSGRAADTSTTDRAIDLSPPTGDHVTPTTCYMCACRCGILVHVKDGRVRYIEGNRRHPINRGVLCAKGSAGIMQHGSPARLRAPLLRVGERGAGEFREISWDEALDIATGWLAPIRHTDPRRLGLFTGRDQSQSFTGWWAAQFGTPNFAAHGGFCSVNMAAAGQYSIGGSFWEFGEPDWEHARILLMFGVAEDHDSNPIKIGLSRMRARGARIISVNPARTGYSAIADEWIGIRPGTDGLLIMALIHELLRADRIDLDFLVRYTNATALVIRAPGTAEDGLILRDEAGRPLAWDRDAAAPADAARPGLHPAVVGEVTLPDGRRAVPVFHLLAERYLGQDYVPEAVAERGGVPAARIRALAAELAAAALDDPVVIDQSWTDTDGHTHPRMEGRAVSMHAMRGISAHANGFHTCRALHLLQMLLGAIDRPGSWRYKSPYPRPCPPGAPPAGRTTAPDTAIAGNLLGFPMGPEDLLVAADGTPLRLDHAFSWEAPLAVHGMLHTAIGNAAAGDPYRLDTLLLYMANMAWNSAMNPADTMHALTARDENGEYRIPHIIYSDAYASEMVAYADLILPDTTYLERWDCVSLLDRPIGSAHGPADAIRQPVVPPDRDVRAFQDVMVTLGARLGLPGLTNADGTAKFRDYADYITRHERSPGIGPLAGWRGADGSKIGRGEPNPDQLARYTENGCFWQHHLPPEQLYFKFANRAYLEGAHAMGLIGSAAPIVLQLYAEPLQRFRLAALGHGAVQPPERFRARIRDYFDPLPIWYPAFEPDSDGTESFPMHAITQRPMAMYHSWGSQNAWLRQIHTANRLFLNPVMAAKLGIVDDGWVWVSSRHGKLRCQVRLMHGVEANTAWTWNAIGKRAGAWTLAADAPEARQGFLLNHVISEWLDLGTEGHIPNADPITGQAAWFDLRVRIEPVLEGEDAVTSPAMPPLLRPVGIAAPPTLLREAPR